MCQLVSCLELTASVKIGYSVKTQNMEVDSLRQTITPLIPQESCVHKLKDDILHNTMHY